MQFCIVREKVVKIFISCDHTKPCKGQIQWPLITLTKVIIPLKFYKVHWLLFESCTHVGLFRQSILLHICFRGLYIWKIRLFSIGNTFYHSQKRSIFLQISLFVLSSRYLILSIAQVFLFDIHIGLQHKSTILVYSTYNFLSVKMCIYLINYNNLSFMACLLPWLSFLSYKSR